MINKIIAESIKSNKRIVVPGFGAFIRKDTGEVVLVEFLKKDDGVLTSLIMAHAGISQQEAIDAITQYIAKIKRNVAQTGDYYIEGLGKIYVNSNGLYELQYLGNRENSDMNVSAAANETPTQPVYSQPSANASATSGTRDCNPAETVDSRFNAANQPQADIPPHPAYRYYNTPQAEENIGYKKSAYTTTQHTQATDPAIRQQFQKRPVYRPTYTQPKQKKRTDLVMIIAISAAIIALAAIVFSTMVNGSPASHVVPVNPVIEQPADSI